MNPSDRAQLLMSFVNTLDVEERTDELATPADFSRWLLQAGVLTTPRRVLLSDHQLALDLRAGLREALGISVGVQADTSVIDQANNVLHQLPIYAVINITSPLNVLCTNPIRRALTELIITWTYLAITGEILRIKKCAEHNCGWVFWDSSKNHSRRWCSMQICGNRNKARTYLTRHTSTGTNHHPNS